MHNMKSVRSGNKIERLCINMTKQGGREITMQLNQLIH